MLFSNFTSDLQTCLVFIVDTLVAAWMIVHIIVAFPTMIPVESDFKKLCMTTQHKLFKMIYNNTTIPYFALCMNLTILTLGIYIEYYMTTATSTDDGNSTLIPISRTLLICQTIFWSFFIRKMADTMISIGTDRIIELEHEVERKHIETYQPPSKEIVNNMLHSKWIKYDVFGLDNISVQQPALYVMNHNIYGFEMPTFYNHLYQNKNIYLRGLADHFHFNIPFHSNSLRWIGAVDGTRSNVDCLMESKQNVLVFPGGAHEVNKHSSVPKYKLMWKERLGFAIMAIKHGYPIIPCCSIGLEDIIDQNIILDIPLQWFRKDLTFPIPGFISPYNLQKFYYFVGKPIETKQYNGNYQNLDYAREVRDKAKKAIEDGIKFLQNVQKNDPNRYYFRSNDNVSSSLKQKRK